MTRRTLIAAMSALLGGWLAARAAPAVGADQRPFAGFLRAYPADPQVRRCTQEQCKAWAGKLPDALLHFWREVGRGTFGGGIIAIVDPQEWRTELSGWLLGNTEGRTVIARSAFGDLFYYRDLGIHEVDGVRKRVSDISRIDPHAVDGEAEVCSWDIEDFFDDYLCRPESADSSLRRELYVAARQRLGKPEGDQGFFFVPALRLGGTARAESIHKGDLHVQLDILLQLAQAP